MNSVNRFCCVAVCVAVLVSCGETSPHSTEFEVGTAHSPIYQGATIPPAINGISFPNNLNLALVRLFVADCPSCGGGERCTGLVIDHKHVLTAAHCFAKKPDNTPVYVFLDNSEIPFAKSTTWIPHGKYSIDTSIEEAAADLSSCKDTTAGEPNGYDVALVVMQFPANMPIIPTATSPEPMNTGSSVWVAGYGNTQLDLICDENSPSDKLLWSVLSVTDTSDGLQMFAWSNSSFPMHGDSGSPALAWVAQSNTVTPVGVLSWGRDDCKSKTSCNVFTRLDSPGLLPWIASVIDTNWKPFITIEQPSANATVDSGSLVKAKVTDNDKGPEYIESLTTGSASVSFEIVNFPSWKMSYNASLQRWIGDLGPYITNFAVSNGSHTIRVTAKDASGANVSYATVSVTVSNPVSTCSCAVCGCPAGQVCIGTTCSVPTCTSHATWKCVNGDVYYFDSCGKLEEMKEPCGDLSCQDAKCVNTSASDSCTGVKPCSAWDGFQTCYEIKCGTSTAQIMLDTETVNTSAYVNGKWVYQKSYSVRAKCKKSNNNYKLYYSVGGEIDTSYCKSSGCTGNSVLLPADLTTTVSLVSAFGASIPKSRFTCWLNSDDQSWASVFVDLPAISNSVVHCFNDSHCGSASFCDTSGDVSSWQCKTDPCAGKECGDGCGTCAADKKCVSGKCECSGICAGGKKLCATKDTYFTCGDSDGNGCLQWSSSTATCKSNEICSNDLCVCEYSSCATACCASGQVCSMTTGACCTPTCGTKKCGDDTCGGSCGICSVPPPPACDTDGKTLLTYSGTGTCSSGTCTYPQTKQTCQYSCSGGACVSDPCAGKTCSVCQKCSVGACVADTTKSGVACDDGNVCTFSTTCQSGSCSGGKAVVCDDNKPCTIDACDTTKGCTSANATPTTLCDDSNACTTGDYCFSGSCIGKYLVQCDDSDACTTDSCDTKLGCQHAAMQCPTGQTCQNGSCVSDPCVGKNCPTCQKCSGGACVLDTNGTTCNDNDACTTSDVCTNGVCVGVSNPLTCKPAGDICGNAFVITPGSLPYTVSGSTADAGGDYGYSTAKCPPETGGWGAGSKDEVYSFKPTVTGAYNIQFTAHDFDANLYVVTNCASVDTTCVAGDEDVGNSALESVSVTLTANTLYYIMVDGYDTVAPGSSGTYTLSVKFSCVAVCSGKVCGDDGCGGNCGSCSGGQTCQNSSCVSDPCVGKNCDDTNVCTSDGCTNGTCIHTSNTSVCSDGNACTKDDTCSGGWCVGTPLVCDDKNPCTNNTCDTTKGCTSLPVDGFLICDDSNACTKGDHCSVGACVGSSAVTCNDGDTCTSDFCDAKVGCIFTAKSCPLGQVCTNGACNPIDLTCDSFCTLAMQACTGANAQWSSQGSCLASCQTWPVGNLWDTSGNSLGCRLYHVQVAATSAASAEIHCPHAGSDGGGVCVGCTPDCTSKQCGDDSCGGSCGTCGEKLACELGSCKGVQCASCSNGCASGYSCLSWVGFAGNWCAAPCGSANDCPTSNICQVPQGESSGRCTPETFVGCVNNDVSLKDTCGNVLTTYETCVSPQSCTDGSCVCITQCTGKTCGDDGCGSSCGTCKAGEKCVDNICTAPPLGDTCGNPFSIPGLPFAYIGGDTNDANPDYSFDDYKCPGSKGKGKASNDEVFKFVPNTTGDYVILLDATFDSALYVATDCSSINTSCLAGADTSKAEKITAKLSKGTAYYIVVDGYSNTSNISGEYTLSVEKTCVPNCSGKACGDDGCGGSCGSCASGKQCSSADTCVDCLGTAACDDGNKCTSADACKNGKCVGTSKICDDGNPCTDDTCNPATGCSFTPKSCPNGGTCKNGKCPGCVPDQYEPDGSVATASLINLGESQTRSICPLGDPDYVRVVLEKSEVVAVSAQGDNVDLALGIYSSKGELATINTNGEGWTEFYEETLQPDQYVVVVSQAGPGEGGTYTLTITSSCSPQCDTKKCGDDGCGGNCGTCKEHYACNGGNCYWQPYCGDFDCRWKEDENCETCPQDCKCPSDQSCVSGTCVVVVEPVEPTPDDAIDEADVIDVSGAVTDAGSTQSQSISGDPSSGCDAGGRTSMPAVVIVLLLFVFLGLFRMRRQRH